ncbi:uncharacterized protein BXZ73DRAFT_36870 [Epithele typhae]|uniref:uncharacterized protein n=1 Tax=Epithele typhae TaxID=378194 RepID=UPI00200890B8|nr:uncharacterized protein BXZ73DRAFT_36870 [Epithele typhae]KAH9945804.1 hypothetical protein BXZ73DRAFT_36870 [Epithele typhae]
MMPVQYYQIGGFRAHWRGNDFDNDNAAKHLMQKGVKLSDFSSTTGIHPNGASALLLPASRSAAVIGRVRGRPYEAHMFLSLSPIEFAGPASLAEKLKRLESKKGGPKGAEPRDRSQANTQYTAGGPRQSTDGERRARFEHQRVLYQVLQEAIELEDYALAPAKSLYRCRICAFAFNLWAADTRVLPDRHAEPQMLDIGWTEFDAPSQEGDLTPASTTHVVIEEGRLYKNHGKRPATLPDVTQTLTLKECSRLLKELLTPEENERRDQPILFLVHNATWAKSVLRALGVDANQWKGGVSDLLYSARSAPRLAGGVPESGRAAKTRSRSRSPQWREALVGGRARSPHRREQPAVHLVDVRELYECVMHVPKEGDTVRATARALNVKDDEREAVDGLCAGTESRLVGLAWEAMAMDTAVDEQRAIRLKFHNHDAAMPPMPPMPPAGAGDADEEVDPNDIIPSGRAQGAPGPSFDYDDLTDSDFE